MKTIRDRSRDVLGDQSGSLLPMGAIGLILVAALVGGGVDMSRAYKAQNRLQAACDAAVLAGRKAVTTNGFDDTAKNEAASYFANNFNSTEQDASGTVFNPTSDDNGNTIEGSASTNISSAIMQIFGFGTIAVDVTCSASMGVGNSDVTMVLDTTGSMNSAISWGGDSKISMLRDAMKNFYDTVAQSVSGTNARVRYAFVPYSSTVNVGRLLYDKNPAWLVDDYWIQSRKPRYEQIVDHWGDPVTTTSTGESDEKQVSQNDYNSTEYGSRYECSAALPNNTDWQNSGSPTTVTSPPQTTSNDEQVTTTATTQSQTRTEYTCVQHTRGRGRNRVTYYSAVATVYSHDLYDYTYETRPPVYRDGTKQIGWLYKRLKYDVRSYKAFNTVSTLTGGSSETSSYNVSSKWKGCIEERQTTPAASFTFNKSTGITPSSAKDLDIDTPPDPSDDSTRWAPMWQEVAYRRLALVNSGWSSYYQATNADESYYGTPEYSTDPRYNMSFCPYQAQLLKVMSKSSFYDYADSLTAEGSTYHDLGILWGARLSSPQGIFADTVNQTPANGGNVSRHMIFMTDGALEPNNSIQSAYGIEYHDRRVTANGTNLLTERHASRFLALCQAVKAKGIRLWVIAFSTGLTNDLSTCASDNSAFTANDADELNKAFQEIAKQVGELRVTQ